ncbi:MmcQ/YjbR family DNA-binding protein [Niabella insulamsoli]|uniref:MmcQ/YjbR family DNA-binding protein n=1 Tax=Niabella insulamsoli TaxID=3144874 RepID=UPI0031FE1F3D
MHIEIIRDYCLSKKDVEEVLPFGPETLVYKVNGKIFLLMGMDADPLSFNVKCDPDLALELRENYDCVQPGYHMNKKHWNTIVVDGSMPAPDLKKWIDHSYDLVAKKSKRKS